MGALKNRRILLGICGGIAAYKSAELTRRLRDAGAQVRVVMTDAAQRFITPLTLQALSGHPVRCTLFDPDEEAALGHIELARWADAVVVAPASADFMARLAGGLANDLLATLCLATSAPIALAPAMNRQMWEAPATRRNAALLAEQGVHLFGPASGAQACGEVGPGRMLEPAELVALTAGLFGAGPLHGLTLMVTAGPTREPIDPVRYLTNRSSGKMGFAIAAAAAAAGARVILVSGPVALPTPPGVERHDVETAAEMGAVVARFSCDIFIAAAAVADYRPAQAAPQKIKKAQAQLTLQLLRNPDILAAVSGRPNPPFTVGFAAETEDLEANARAKLVAKGLGMVAANRVGPGVGFESDRNALHLFWEGGAQELALGEKRELARRLVEAVAERYRHWIEKRDNG